MTAARRAQNMTTPAGQEPRVVAMHEIPDPTGAAWDDVLTILLEAGREPEEASA